MLEIGSKELDNGLIKVTLIHSWQEDDAQRAIKILMTAKMIGQKWNLHEIKTNRKCWGELRHTDRRTEWCN